MAASRKKLMLTSFLFIDSGGDSQQPPKKEKELKPGTISTALTVSSPFHIPTTVSYSVPTLTVPIQKYPLLNILHPPSASESK